MSKANNIWVVDDERSIRWVLEKALSQRGWEVNCFDSADQILDQLDVAPRVEPVAFRRTRGPDQTVTSLPGTQRNSVDTGDFSDGSYRKAFSFCTLHGRTHRPDYLYKNYTQKRLFV